MAIQRLQKYMVWSAGMAGSGQTTMSQPLNISGSSGTRWG